VDSRILDICRDDPRFAYEAYKYICDAVTFTAKRLASVAQKTEIDTDDHHITGAELLSGVCDMAVNDFGMMAPIVFSQWGIRTTDDIGTIVFKLIEAKCLSKSERDSPEDFHNLFDLNEALTKGFSFKIEDPHSAKRGNR
jgi:uncharacterized repeat protein (TIGR04138 family)